MILTITHSILGIGSPDHGVVNNLSFPNNSPISALDSLALLQNIRKALNIHSTSNPIGVEVSSQRIAAVIIQKAGGSSATPVASGILSTGYPGSPTGVRLASPPKSFADLIERNGNRISISKNAINSPYLDILLSNLHEIISSLEEERLERSSLGSIECGNLTIYPTMHGNHHCGYIIEILGESSTTNRSFGFIDTETGNRTGSRSAA